MVFAQQQLDEPLAWSPLMRGGNFAGLQPELLPAAEWQELLAAKGSG